MIDREKELKRALLESLKLQAHYAKLLNMHDGGRRRIFTSIPEWMDRIRLVRSPEKQSGTGTN